jgi:arylsulfatase
MNKVYLAADNRIDNLGKATSYDGVGPGWAGAAAAPSWRFKDYASEGGIRTPAFLAGPEIKARVADTYVNVMDVLPTFLDIADIGRPEGSFAGRKVQPIRGKSWLNWLGGHRASVYDPGDEVGEELFGSRSLRQGDWKITDVGDGEWRLFDVATDPGETRDLSAVDPARKAALVKAWDDYANKVGVVMPNPPVSIIQRRAQR